jgi:hypothetical protein
MPDRISLLALVCPVGELANDQLRLSRFQRFLFRRLARRPWATRLFFRRLRTMVFRSPDSAYRWLMARLRAPDRELLASAVRASLQAAMGRTARARGCRRISGFIARPGLASRRYRCACDRLAGGDDPVVLGRGLCFGALPNCRLDVIGRRALLVLAHSG